MDLPALDAGEVEGVHGLAVLEHDIVCDIDDVVDGTHARVADTLAHPGGRRGDLHVAHHAAGVADAEGILDEDLRELVDVAAGGRFHNRLVQLELFVKGDGGLARKADHAQAVGTVRGDLKLDHVVVQAEQYAHIVAGLAVLVQDEDAVGDAVGKLLLFRVQILGREDAVSRRVVGHQIADVHVLEIIDALDVLIAGIQHGVPEIDSRGGEILYTRHDHAAVDGIAGLDVGGNRRLGRINGVIVVQKRGGLDDGAGEIMNGDVQLLEGAEHTGGLHAAELALGDLRAAGQQGVVERRGDKVALMHVPGAGADLDGGLLADVDLRDQHVVGVGVLFKLEDFADLDVFDGLAQVLGHLDLGAGNGHRLGEAAVVVFLQRQVNKLIEPFSR